MPDTTNRPTPQELAESYDSIDNNSYCEYMLDALAEHGYVIVHPDDVPVSADWGQASDAEPDYGIGWSDCRAHIFGDDQ